MNFKAKLKSLLLKIFRLASRLEAEHKMNELKRKLNKVGSNFQVLSGYSFLSPQYMEIGNNFSAGERFRIEAWDKYGTQSFTPQITIGDNVIFNTDIHIGCINKIEIGENCLFASRIYITDHHHGEPAAAMLQLAPKDRPLITKGPVIIEKNVWVGEGVAIMPNVRIGENSIIATNAVVTKDVPQNCVVAGVPAKVIKVIK